MTRGEPQEVTDARLTIRNWELRQGHQSFPYPIDGGWLGYQARCYDCDWEGTEFLRGDEEMGTEESRAHKDNARREAAQHREETKP